MGGDEVLALSLIRLVRLTLEHLLISYHSPPPPHQSPRLRTPVPLSQIDHEASL